MLLHRSAAFLIKNASKSFFLSSFLLSSRTLSRGIEDSICIPCNAQPCGYHIHFFTLYACCLARSLKHGPVCLVYIFPQLNGISYTTSDWQSVNMCSWLTLRSRLIFSLFRAQTFESLQGAENNNKLISYLVAIFFKLWDNFFKYGYGITCLL